MVQALCWWWLYLKMQIKSTYYSDTSKRKVIRIWTDAAGADRWLAAVVFADGRWLWTRWKVTDKLWNQFEARRDDQIAMQELLAIPLAFETFKDIVSGSLCVVYVDNAGAMMGVIKGSCGASDINAAIARIWMDAVECNIGMHLCRVESKANLADGPTRDDWRYLQRLNAVFVPPRIPKWFEDVAEPMLPKIGT